MSETLAILNCSQVITLAGPPRPRVGSEMCELSIIKGGVFVRDSRIELVCSDSEIQSLIEESTTVVDAGGRVLLPGFVDAHTHPVFAGTRADEFEERAAGATY